MVEVSESKSSLFFLFGFIINVLLIGGNNLSIFLSVYPDLVHSVKPCVMTVADHCYSIGLISQDTYDQLCERKDLTDKNRTRILLDNIRRVFLSRPSALQKFVTVLFQTGECNHLADKIHRQLQ